MHSITESGGNFETFPTCTNGTFSSKRVGGPDCQDEAWLGDEATISTVYGQRVYTKIWMSVSRRPSFDWDDANTAHLARHRITRDEAEQVFLALRSQLRLKSGVVRTGIRNWARPAPGGSLWLCGRGGSERSGL